MINRRSFLGSTLAGLAAATGRWRGAARAGGAPRSSRAGTIDAAPATQAAAATPGGAGTRAAVLTPDGVTLPHTLEDGVKVFRLVAEPVQREFVTGLNVNCWGYNGLSPGPTIEAVEGDRVRVLVTNHLPEPTSVHWHGMRVPNGMDGVSGLDQPPIPPGETFQYEFTLRQHGTQMYHPHFDEMTQIARGMMGFFVIHPRDAALAPADRDFCLFLHEWYIQPGGATPDPSVMSDFNVFTINSRAYPGTTPMVARLGQRVRIRFANLSMDSHPMHLHGVTFRVTGTGGGRIPAAAQWPETTIDVPAGSTRDIEFVADAPGDWALHCHKTHHTMNQMAHNLPLMLGVDGSGLDQRVSRLVPGAMTMGRNGMGDAMEMGAPPNSVPMKGSQGPDGHIDMGGMFTMLKVRAGIATYDDPGWYRHPPGTQAHRVGADRG